MRLLKNIVTVGCLFLICLNPFPGLTAAQEKILTVDTRQRPPEMTTDGTHHSGPLPDIIREAAEHIGYGVQFRKRQFKASLTDLGNGKTDILPRTFCTAERTRTIEYLGPIGYQEKAVVFLVRKGQEKMIQNFEDLKKISVGVKSGTVYFDAFDRSDEIRRIEAPDDANLVRMFDAGNFETMIIIDRDAAEMALKENRITDYTYAEYRHYKVIGNYFGIRPDHPAKERLQKALEEMVTSGRVKAVYKRYGAEPPVFKESIGFLPCQPE